MVKAGKMIGGGFIIVILGLFLSAFMPEFFVSIYNTDNSVLSNQTFLLVLVTFVGVMAMLLFKIVQWGDSHV